MTQKHYMVQNMSRQIIIIIIIIIIFYTQKIKCQGSLKQFSRFSRLSRCLFQIQGFSRFSRFPRSADNPDFFCSQSKTKQQQRCECNLFSKYANVKQMTSTLKTLTSDSHLPKKVVFICSNDSPSKMMKSALHFILKALSVLKIFKLLS